MMMEELCLVPSCFLPLFNTFSHALSRSCSSFFFFFLISLFILELFRLFSCLLLFSSRPLLRLWLHNLSAIFHFSVSWLELLKYSRASTAHHQIQEAHTHKHTNTDTNTKMQWYCFKYLFLHISVTRTDVIIVSTMWARGLIAMKRVCCLHIQSLISRFHNCPRTYSSTFSNINKERSQMNIYTWKDGHQPSLHRNSDHFGCFCNRTLHPLPTVSAGRRCSLFCSDTKKLMLCRLGRRILSFNACDRSSCPISDASRLFVFFKPHLRWQLSLFTPYYFWF